jgi:hypothetical protein
MLSSPTASSKEVIPDYNIALIVAGTRKWNDFDLFSKYLFDYIDKLDDKSIIFISGAARTGADRLVIDWCKLNGFPWVEFPADWDIGLGAGYRRNTEMSKYGTHLLTFWDGFSKGTRHMVAEAKKRKLWITTLIIETLTEGVDYGW